MAAANKCLTSDDVQSAIDEMRGAVMIVYPMGLPPHDPIKMEFDNEEDLSGTQVYYINFIFLLSFSYDPTS